MSGTVATGPDDSSVQVIETKVTGSTSIHELLINLANNEISEAILTNSLSTSVQKSGARASSETGATTIEGGLGKEDIDFPTAFFNIIFKRTIDLNIGSGLYPKFKFIEEENINKEKSDRDKTLSEIGVKFNKDYFINNYNLKEDEFEIPEPADKKQEQLNLPVIPEVLDKTIPVSKTELSSLQKLFKKVFKIDLAKDDTPESVSDNILNALSPKVLQYGIEQTLKPVIDLAKNTNSRDEFLHKLSLQYPEMKTDVLEDILLKTLIISDIEGRIKAKSEGKK